LGFDQTGAERGGIGKQSRKGIAHIKLQGRGEYMRRKGAWGRDEKTELSGNYQLFQIS